MSDPATQNRPFTRTVVYELTEGVLSDIEPLTLAVRQYGDDSEVYASSPTGEPVPVEVDINRQMLLASSEKPLILGDTAIIGLPLRDETCTALVEKLRQIDERLADTAALRRSPGERT